MPAWWNFWKVGVIAAESAVKTNPATVWITVASMVILIVCWLWAIWGILSDVNDSDSVANFPSWIF